MDYVVWDDLADGKRCHLPCLLNSPAVAAYLCEGISLKDKWSDDAAYEMDELYKTRMRLTDSLINRDRALVISEKLRDFLVENGAGQGNEFLPVSIINHKGRKEKAKHYVVVNTAPMDAFDQVKSVFERNTIDTKQIDEVKKLVVDESKIDPTAKLFRFKYFKWPTLVKQELADKITEAGFTGVSFLTLDEYVSLINS